MSAGFKRILVPLDGSERAERAIPIAARIARAQESELLLVHVVNPAMPFGPPFDAAGYTVAMEIEAASRYLRDIARRDDLAGLHVQLRVMEHTHAATALLEAVELHQCELVVICSHGRSGLTRWALGSVAQKLARHCTVPVLVVRARGTLPAEDGHESDHRARALVALDGSAFAEAALLPAAQVVSALAGPAGGRIHVLRVLDPSYVGNERGERVLMDRDAREAPLDDVETYLRELAERLSAEQVGQLGVDVTWSIVEDADAAGTVLAVAENGRDTSSGSNGDRCDLIAMATHGRTGIQLWQVGSVTDRVLQASTLPLLIVHPPRAAATTNGGEPKSRAELDLQQEAGIWPGYQ